MAAPSTTEALRSGHELLRRICADGEPEHLAITLAATLGIVLANAAQNPQGGLVLLALADCVVRATYAMQQAQAALADCKGSA